jgi:Tol biopolymer transport system component
MATIRQLTRDGRLKMDPVFLRGGEELVFTLQETPVQMSLMRLKLTDGSVERLHPQATASEFEAAFSPDGRYCAFVQSRANLNLKLIIRDTKQNRDAVFDPGGGFAGMRRPSIAPDLSRVVFSIPSPTGQQIASVNLQGQDRKDLTQAGLNNGPTYSPDGRQIAFGSSRDGNFEIYVMNADGSNARRLTNSPALDVRPAWSPDGKRIAFTSNRDGNYEIYVMNADGSEPRRITHHAERDDYAVWHPDGRHLAMVSERNGRFDLYVLEV